ncbi:hypothetical protein MGA3_12820 [Bacillus methanolicus MGA3]|nr:hypothetical protein MGA3_12820 [Bacillus methanolicus MGA3]
MIVLSHWRNLRAFENLYFSGKILFYFIDKKKRIAVSLREKDDSTGNTVYIKRSINIVTILSKIEKNIFDHLSCFQKNYCIHAYSF